MDDNDAQWSELVTHQWNHLKSFYWFHSQWWSRWLLLASPILCLSFIFHAADQIYSCFRWPNHADVCEKDRNAPAGCCPVWPTQVCLPQPSNSPPAPQHPYPVQWDRCVGEGLSSRDPTQIGEMVETTDYGELAAEYAAGGEKVFSYWFLQLVTQEPDWPSTSQPWSGLRKFLSQFQRLGSADWSILVGRRNPSLVFF